MSTFISTYTGRRFYPLDPQPSDVCIEDIAHSLAMICRFNGHVQSFYSVAEHSVHVSRIVPPEYALAGLLHDASEAYIADVSAPVKPHLQNYRVVEANIMVTVSQIGPDNLYDHLFGVTGGTLIHTADRAMLALEARSLLPYDPWMDDLPAPADVTLGLWSPERAERAFLERYEELVS